MTSAMTFVHVTVMILTLARKVVPHCDGTVCKTVTMLQGEEGVALMGYTFENATLSHQVSCLDYCALDCRCISFNAMIDGNVCELNYENKSTSPQGLQPRAGFYYQEMHLVYEKSKKVRHRFCL